MDPHKVQKPPRQSWYDGNGNKAARKSSDSVWPLRRANGLTYAQAKGQSQ